MLEKMLPSKTLIKNSQQNPEILTQVGKKYHLWCTPFEICLSARGEILIYALAASAERKLMMFQFVVGSRLINKPFALKTCARGEKRFTLSDLRRR